jgi:hypothetical protein
MRRLVQDGWIRNPEVVRMLEPSCGAFAWVRAAIAIGIPAVRILANDLNLDAVAEIPEDLHGVRFESQNFLNAEFCEFDLIVGNPPYNDTMAHLEVSFNALTPTGILAQLLPIGWFTAQGGKDRTRQQWLDCEGKPAHVYLITPRPKFREGPGTDSAAYALVVWAPGARRSTGFDILDWLDDRTIDDDVRKAERATKKPSAP